MHKTKQKIVDAALVLFVRQGVDATTTRDIASAAQVAEGTIYRHFESKDALATELFESEFVPFAAALERIAATTGPVQERIAATVKYFYRAFDADPARWTYIMTFQGGAWSRVPEKVMTPVKLMVRLLAQANEQGEVKLKDVALTAQILLGVIEHPAMGVIFGELKGPLGAYQDEVLSAVAKTLRD